MGDPINILGRTLESHLSIAVKIPRAMVSLESSLSNILMCLCFYSIISFLCNGGPKFYAYTNMNGLRIVMCR